MYQKITTEGIVLRKRAVGESNIRVWVLTKELGLVVASARSARKAESKLRYGLEPLTMARFCFVKGVHEWRVAEAACVRHIPASPAKGRISQLLLRLIHGQEPLPALYRDIAEGFLAWDSPEVETVVVLRILSHLGYLPRTEALQQFVEGEFNVELAARALESRGLLIKTINESLKVTGL